MDKYDFTKEIMDQLTQKVERNKEDKLERYTDAIRSQSDKKTVLVVILGTNIGLNHTFDNLLRLKRYGFRVNIALSKMGEEIIGTGVLRKGLNPNKIYTEKDQLHCTSILADSNGIIIPMATQNTAIKLALGIQDSFIPNLLWECLWEGKPIFMDFESLIKNRGKKSKDLRLEEMIVGYCNKLESMGIKSFTRKDFLMTILEGFQEDKPLKKGFEEETHNTKAHKVITERDIKDLSKDQKELIIPSRTIITPLAYDTAKTNGIKITRR